MVTRSNSVIPLPKSARNWGYYDSDTTFINTFASRRTSAHADIIARLATGGEISAAELRGMGVR
jgi:hypothetical protein